MCYRAAWFFGLSAALLATASASKDPAPVYEYTKVNTFPHDRQAFTQGLLYPADEVGYLYEGTGLYGKSVIRKVRLATGEVVQEAKVANHKEFGEGIVIFGDRLYQLTWQENVINVYDRASFRLQQKLPNPREGWGLTTDGRWLIMSDGTDLIFFLHPGNCSIARQIAVRNGGRRVTYLNELEYIKGEIWSNVWQTDLIHVIDPNTGLVSRTIDFHGLQPVKSGDVLNGIAYDAANDKVYVTGKMWPELYEIRVKDVCKNNRQPCPPFYAGGSTAAAPLSPSTPVAHAKPLAASPSLKNEATEAGGDAGRGGGVFGLSTPAVVFVVVLLLSAALFALRRRSGGGGGWRPLFDNHKPGDETRLSPNTSEGARSLKRRGRSKY